MLYHTTSPESAVSILKNGFEDRHESCFYRPPGVWVSRLPVISAIGFDPFLGHTEERHLAIDIPPGVCKPYEILDLTWPCSQFLLPSKIVNWYPIREIPLAEVVRIRKQADPCFIDELFSVLESSALRFCWSYAKSLMAREYEPPRNDYVEAIDNAIILRDQYLEYLRVISDAAPHKYDRIRELVDEVFSMA